MFVRGSVGLQLFSDLEMGEGRSLCVCLPSLSSASVLKRSLPIQGENELSDLDGGRRVSDSLGDICIFGKIYNTLQLYNDMIDSHVSV